MIKVSYILFTIHRFWYPAQVSPKGSIDSDKEHNLKMKERNQIQIPAETIISRDKIPVGIPVFEREEKKLIRNNQQMLIRIREREQIK